MIIGNAKCPECGAVADVHKDKVKHYLKCNQPECRALILYQSAAAKNRLLARTTFVKADEKTEQKPNKTEGHEAAAAFHELPIITPPKVRERREKPSTKPVSKPDTTPPTAPKNTEVEPKRGGFFSTLF